MDDKPSKDASLADGVIAGLRDGGELHSEGQFTMDREVARAKLSEFQLTDPRWSLLLIVRAAVRRGARRLDVEVDADDIRFTFDGSGFDDVDFEHLYDDPFSGRVDDKHAGRRELALGLNAALALEPRHIRVRSGRGELGAELELRPGKPDRYGRLNEPPDTTEVHLKLRRGLVVRAVSKLSDVLPEVALLRERCQYASIEVTVNGERISSGLELREVVAPRSFEAEGVTGVSAYWREAAEPPGVRVVTDGVWIASLEAEPTPRELGVVLQADGIRTDLTQFRLVEGEKLDALLAAADQGWRDAVERVMALADDGEAEPLVDRDWCRRTLREAQLRFDDLDDYRGARPDPLALKLSRLSLWQTARTGSAKGGYRSLDLFLRKADRQRRVAYVTQDDLESSSEILRSVLPGLSASCLVTASEADAALLEHLLGKSLVYATRYYGAPPLGEHAAAVGAKRSRRIVRHAWIAGGVLAGMFFFGMLLFGIVRKVSGPGNRASTTSKELPAAENPFPPSAPPSKLTAGEILGVIPADVGSNAELRKQCTAGQGASCFYLAHRLKNAEQDLVRKMYTGRLELREGCLLAHLASCAHLGTHERKQYRAQCKAGDAESCYLFALMIESGGFGLIKGPGSSRPFFDVACTRGYPKACAYLKKHRKVSR